MNIPITSVSKTEQTLSRAASAVSLIMPDAIRRSGAINITDLSPTCSEWSTDWKRF